MTGSRGEFARAGAPAPHLSRRRHTALTSSGEMSLERRWTPSAWTASATSVRELIRSAVLRSRVLSSQVRDDSSGFSGQRLQVPAGEIFFANLDVVNAGSGGFRDFFQEAVLARKLIPWERGAVGNVVKEAAGRHQLSSKIITTKGTKVHEGSLWPGLRDLRQRFAFFFRRAA